MQPSFFSIFLEDAPLLSFRGSHIPRSFARCCSISKKKREKRKMATSSGADMTFKWSKEQTEEFIRVRGQNDNLFTGAKHSAAFGWRTVLEIMGLQGKVKPQQLKKKWDNLKKKYKDCKYPGTGEWVSGKPTAATWPPFVLMDEVLGQRPSIAPPVLIAPIPEDIPGDQEEDMTFKWSKERTEVFIRVRGQSDNLFTGAKHSAAVGWRTILEIMGLQGKVEPHQLKKKWDNLKKKYKDCKYPGTGEGVSGKPTAATWPPFVLMDEVLGQRPSIAPPVLIAPIPEDTPGPSAADMTFKWSKERTEEFIRARGQSDNLFTGAKHSAAVGWRTILKKMGLQGKVKPQQLKKKWDNLKKKYKDCKYPETGEWVSGKPTAATWPPFVLMDEVLGQRPSIAPPVLIAPIPEDTPGPSAADMTFKWSKEQTEEFIRVRGQSDNLFTGAKHSAAVGWRTILEKMGLQGKVKPQQLKKKWDNLKKKYKDCKYPETGEWVSGKPTAATWPPFVLMDEVLGQRPSIAPPVLIAPIPEDTPGDQEEDKKIEEESQPGPRRKRRREDELLELIREEMRLQREAEERRARESKERMDRMERLFSLLERMADR